MREAPVVVAVWSVKGGVGVSSVAALLAIGQVERAEDVLLVDLDGDLPALLGLEDPTGAPGLAEWCAMSDPAPDALQRLEVEARSGLRIIPRGSGPFANSAAPLMTALASYRRQVIVDCGVIRSDDTMASDLILRADQSLLVARECYLTLRALREQTRSPWCHRAQGVASCTRSRRRRIGGYGSGYRGGGDR